MAVLNINKTKPRLSAWITGASKGIGRALAIEFAREGWTVAASGRDITALESLVELSENFSGKIKAYPFDITDGARSEEVYDRLEKDIGPIRLDILNAGTYIPEPAKDFNKKNFRFLFETNLMGTVNCLNPVIKQFVNRGQGHIVIVSSLVGYCGLPSSSAYGATKAALINMCESLYLELNACGVDLSVVTPGFVRTPLTDQNEFYMPLLMEPEKAAKRIIQGIKRNQFEISFPRRMTIIMKFLRLLPYPVFFAITRRLLR